MCSPCCWYNRDSFIFDHIKKQRKSNLYNLFSERSKIRCIKLHYSFEISNQTFFRRPSARLKLPAIKIDEFIEWIIDEDEGQPQGCSFSQQRKNRRRVVRVFPPSSFVRTLFIDLTFFFYIRWSIFFIVSRLILPKHSSRVSIFPAVCAFHTHAPNSAWWTRQSVLRCVPMPVLVLLPSSTFCTFSTVRRKDLEHNRNSEPPHDKYLPWFHLVDERAPKRRSTELGAEHRKWVVEESLNKFLSLDTIKFILNWKIL